MFIGILRGVLGQELIMGECLIVRSGSGVDTSNATASGNKIVEGYSCYVNDELITGDIPIMKLTTSSITPSNKIDIPYGYYDNTNLISVSTLREETVATAVSSDLLIDSTGWSNGTNIIGDIHNNGAISQSMGANTSYTIPQGWHNGSGKVTQALVIQGAVGITAGTGNQTVCDAGRWTTGDLWVWGNGNLVPWNIKNGVEIFGVWGNFTGWVDTTLQAINFQSGNRYISNNVQTILDVVYNGASLTAIKNSFNSVSIWGWVWGKANNGGVSSSVNYTIENRVYVVTSVSSYANEGEDWNSRTVDVQLSTISTYFRIWGTIGATYGLSPHGNLVLNCTATFRK